MKNGRVTPRVERIAALTAYDYPTALLVDGAGVDITLVGDSLGMEELGYDTTVPVTGVSLRNTFRGFSTRPSPP